MKIEDLEFNVMIRDVNRTRGQKVELRKFNVFHSRRVMRSVAMWVAGKAPKDSDFLHWCFSDLAHRTEYEVMVSSWPPVENSEDKFDVFTLYIEPNAKLLREMVDKVSVSSAKNWLKNNK